MARGDSRVVRWQAHMTHTGQFLRYPPTQKNVGEISGITILGIENGKIAAGWISGTNWVCWSRLERCPSNPQARRGS